MRTAIFSKVLAGLFAVTGIAICIESYRLGFFSYGVPAAGLFPFIAGTILALTAGLVVLLPVDEEMRQETVPWRQPVILMIVTALYFLMFEVLGVYLATGIYLAGTLLLLSRVSLGSVALTLGASLVIIYLLFGLWLRTPLPQSPW